jgi:putative ABC transport system permease protein
MGHILQIFNGARLMLHFLATVFRNLTRNRLYSGICIFGLAIGLCAAVLMSLIIENQLTYNRFIRDSQDVYLIASVLTPQGRSSDYISATHISVAAQLKLRFSEISNATRLVDQTVLLHQGQVEAKEKIYWADPNVFLVLPMPAYVGDLKTALQRPDSIVVTRSIARKYFGHENAIGETILLDNTHPMVVTAVIEDLPTNGTELESGVYASGSASYSELARLDNDVSNAAGGISFQVSVITYLRLLPKASPDRLRAGLPALMNQIWPRRPPGVDASMVALRIDKVHLFPGLYPGMSDRLTLTTVIGGLILFLACINFINLSTARAARRALEVGIRKVSGASRAALILQFLGESLVYVLLGTCIAIALVELLIPYVNNFLDISVSLNLRRNPIGLAYIAIGDIALAILAGFYPAFVLSAFRPAEVLGGSIHNSRDFAPLRNGLVVFQFAMLINLLIAGMVVYQQRNYATRDAIRVSTDHIMFIDSPCNMVAFKTELQKLPGVLAGSCVSRALLTEAVFDNIRLKDGNSIAVNEIAIDSGELELYGLKPIAGRFFLAQDTSQPSSAAVPPVSRIIINATAVRALGFSSALGSLGQPLTLSDGEGEVIGVVPDFSLNTVAQTIKPTVYVFAPQNLDLINLKLAKQDVLETLSAIDRLWVTTGTNGSIDRFFLNDYIQKLYTTEFREAAAFGIFACVAALLGCLGLFGLSASTTERRTKEIGIRKALGAGTSDIVKFLIWKFAKPVLWANLIAWPLSAYLMNRWLHGFAYHIDLNPLVFVLATACALVAALLTVFGHCYGVARKNPVTSLRME